MYLVYLNARNKAIAPGFICEMRIAMTPILQLPLEILFATYLSSTCHVLNTQKKYKCHHYHYDYYP